MAEGRDLVDCVGGRTAHRARHVVSNVERRRALLTDECREYLERGRRTRKGGRWDGKEAEERRRGRVEMSKDTLAQLLGWQQATGG